MRLFSILMFTAAMAVSGKPSAQTITYTGKNVPLKQVFTAIEKQTGFLVFASRDVLADATTVSIAVKNMPLQTFLDEVLKNQPLRARMEGKTIFLSRKATASTSPAPPQASPLRVRVMGATGNALSGATIFNKRTKNSGITNAEGIADIKANAGDVLLISFVGYVTQEVTVKDATAPLYISLNASNSKLDEVQIIAYGTTSKRLNTGAVTTVKAEDIEKQPVSNPIIALAGRVPGLAIQQTTGAPGAAVRFNIRGVNSISGVNDPFIIIDGVPFSSTNISMNRGSTLGAFGGASPLDAINPADIASIEVLKDADATAIYGSRGANGVILITTKKGKSGKTGLNVNVYHGLGKVGKQMEMLSTRQYLDMRYEAFANDGVDWRSPSVIANDLKTWDTTRYTNWQDMIVGGTAKYTSAQVGVSGGNQQTQYSLTGNYWKETTVYPGSFYNKKLSGRAGINHRSADDRLRMEFSTFYTYNDNYFPSFNPYNDALYIAPHAPAVYNADGSFNWENGSFRNPLANLKNTQSITSYNLNSSLLLSYRLLKGLSAKANIGYNKVDYHTSTLNPQAGLDPFNADPTNNSAHYADLANTGWNAEPYLDYQASLLGGKLNAMLGTTFQAQSRTNSGVDGFNFLDDALMNNPASAQERVVAPTTIAKYRYNAVFGRLNYNYQDKYIANLTMRRDGSSRFGPGRQFGNFGAVGLAWIFSEEKFMQPFSGILSYGKLRGSYGITGSDAIGDYAYLSTYSVATNATAGRVALRPDRLFNPDYGWESNQKTDIELELGFIDNRIMLSANYYRNRSSNQLVGIPMPAMTGFTSINSNLPATVQNTGVELSLNTVNIKRKDFTWSTSMNMSLPKNKLVAYPNLALSSHATSYIVGKPLQLSMLYNLVGVNPATGVNIYRDANGKDTSFINSMFFTRADRTVLLNTGPRIYGGLTNEFQYKNFHFDFLVIYNWKIRNNDIATMTGVPGLANNIPLYVYENAWRKEGDHAKFQKFTQRTTSPAYRSAPSSSSSAYFSEVFFLRLNNLSFSYTLPEAWQKKIHTSNCRVYLQGQNLFTISDFKGVDPETGTTSMPLMRIMTAGIQFNL
ncbi:SusC/RagA family TonB-linked outer membrane protein [Chitinophaga horti]|uniref:SusC/RagA family TonB-linked outer membrane protein n=1 Tax=Chitinophaga horti TaxID=2920382 RepID=A0ABY6IX42_9BACT|nr:SusC/RagA family TonB-linked outer membrane protein [Chitinophaga horti]UYQ90967.1 SusC/RagA family TonB-linked outer membrane protein [Chitinophaga horti]